MPDAGSAVTEGERWAADALAALRSSGYGPASWASFLRDSWRRAAEIRRERRALSRQAVRWMAAEGLAAAALRRAFARRGGRTPAVPALAAWWLVQALMLDWHLGMVEELDGTPRARLSLADALTLSRAALAPGAACAPPDAGVFLAVLGVAAATDLLDGRLARRRGPTRFGRDFDPLADLAFRAAAVRGARRAGWLGRGSAGALAGRQALLVLGAAWWWFARAQRPPVDPARLARWDAPPSMAGLALAALGHRRAAGALLVTGAVIGGAGSLRGLIQRGDPLRGGPGSHGVPAPPSTRSTP